MNIQPSFLKHALAIGIALVLSFLSVIIISSFISADCNDVREIVISGKQQKIKGYLPDLSKESEDAIELGASLKSKKQLTIFGSSEFSKSSYCSYNYLPAKTSLPVFGLGSPFHQSFSIYCELLAFEEYLKDSRICIILSPAWFETEGTNPQSFLKFFKTDFQRRVLHNDRIEERFKSHIGNWVYDNEKNFSGLTPELTSFKLHAKTKNWNPLVYLTRKVDIYMNSLHNIRCDIPMVEYEFELAPVTKSSGMIHDAEFIDSIRMDFINSISNNDIYVNDEYYRTQLLDDGVERVGEVDKIDLEGNSEYEDLIMLLDLLHSRSADASFIIQPLNPHFYRDLEKNEEVFHTISTLIEDHDFPCLNMYVGQKEDYEAGILKDVMHLGDYGWMQINLFLNGLYQREDEEIN